MGVSIAFFWWCVQVFFIEPAKFVLQLRRHFPYWRVRVHDHTSQGNRARAFNAGHMRFIYDSIFEINLCVWNKNKLHFHAPIFTLLLLLLLQIKHWAVAINGGKTTPYVADDLNLYLLVYTTHHTSYKSTVNICV